VITVGKNIYYTDKVAQSTTLSRKPHIVIGTPGRVLDHILHHSDEIHLKKLKYFVRLF